MMRKYTYLIFVVTLWAVASIIPVVNAQGPVTCASGFYDGTISDQVRVYNNGTPFPVGTRIDYVFNVQTGSPSAATFDGGATLYTVFINDATSPVSGTYVTTNAGEQSIDIADSANGTVDFQFSINGGCDLTVLPDTDPDGDGISGSRDNCPYDYNPDQEDGWGSNMGDVCDTDWYNRTGQGIAGFTQKSGIFNLHGNCVYLDDGAPRCPVIASLDPTTFVPADTPVNVSSADAGTWTVILYYLYSSSGTDVYQVNTYNADGTLMDDWLEFHVSGDSWRWWNRGGGAGDF